MFLPHLYIESMRTFKDSLLNTSCDMSNDKMKMVHNNIRLAIRLEKLADTRDLNVSKLYITVHFMEVE